MPPNHHHGVFSLAIKVLRYFILVIFGLNLICLLSIVLDVSPFTQQTIRSFGNWFWGSGVFVFCLMAIANSYHDFRSNPMFSRRKNQLFDFTIKILKYFVLTIFGVMLTCLFSIVVGRSFIARQVIQNLAPWFGNLGVLIFCLMAIAVVAESLRD